MAGNATINESGGQQAAFVLAALAIHCLVAVAIVPVTAWADGDNVLTGLAGIYGGQGRRRPNSLGFAVFFVYVPGLSLAQILVMSALFGLVGSDFALVFITLSLFNLLQCGTVYLTLCIARQGGYRLVRLSREGVSRMG